MATRKMNLPINMIHQATRYVLGRSTYAVTEHCEWLTNNWFSIPASEQMLVESAVEDAYRRLAIDPEALGDPIAYKPTWDRVRSLWYIGD